MSRLIILDDEQTPLKYLMGITPKGFASVEGVHIHPNCRNLSWDDSQSYWNNLRLDRSVPKGLSTRTEVVDFLNGLKGGQTTILMDLVWDGLMPHENWERANDDIVAALRNFLQRDRTHRVLIYTSRLGGGAIARRILESKSQCDYCNLSRSISDEGEDGASRVKIELENRFGVFGSSQLEDIWNKNSAALFTTSETVPHTFSDRLEQSAYFRTLLDAIDVPLDCNSVTLFFNEGFHESFKSIIGGCARVARGNQYPLTIGGVIALAFVAWAKGRSEFPDWNFSMFTKKHLVKPFARVRSTGDLSVPEHRQIAMLLHKVFCLWFEPKQGTREVATRVEMNVDDIAIKLPWSDYSSEEFESKVNNVNLDYLSIPNSSTAYAYACTELKSHPGKLKITVRDGEPFLEIKIT